MYVSIDNKSNLSYKFFLVIIPQALVKNPHGQEYDTGTFRFGGEVSGFYYHFAVIISHPKGTPVDYSKDSWFAVGRADPEGHSGGSVTITRCDKLNHQIEGSFEGTFYNSDKKTPKRSLKANFHCL